MMTNVMKSRNCLSGFNRRHHVACQATKSSDDSDAVCLTQLIEELKHSQPLVEYRNGEFIFYDEDRRPYTIDDNRVDTPAKLLEWIRHMTEKTWVTGLHINEFVRLAAEHLPRIKIDYNA